MDALRVLFTTDIGLLSLGVIAVTTLMGVFFVRFFLRNMAQDEARARATGK